MSQTASSSAVVVKVLMWLLWGLLGAGCFFFAVFLTQDKGGINSFARPFDLFALLMMVLPFGIAMALRFWLIPRLRSPWVQLLPYIVGVVLSQQILFLGVFLLKEYLAIFYALCAVAMLCYLPLPVRPRQAG